MLARLSLIETPSPLTKWMDNFICYTAKSCIRHHFKKKSSILIGFLIQDFIQFHVLVNLLIVL